MNSTLTSVPIGAASFWSPSRGPTSTMRIFAIPLTLTLSLRARGQNDQRGARGHLLAKLDADLANHTRVRRFHDVLHLHRLQHHQGLVLRHRVAGGDVDLDDARGHRGGQVTRRTVRALRAL